MTPNKFKILSVVICCLVPALWSEAKCMEQDEQDENVFKLCKLPPHRRGVGNGQGLIRMEECKWDGSQVLSYRFLENGGGDEGQKDVVRRAFKEWQDLGISISFREVVNCENAHIKIGFDYRDGSWSYVGKHCITYAAGNNEKSMNFGWDLTTPYGYKTALHEIGHALGFGHEHQNPLSGIRWNVEAVKRYFQGHPNYWDEDTINLNILSNIPIGLANGSSWDPESVMHYDFASGLIEYPTIYQNQPLNTPLKLSNKDIEFVKKLYPNPMHEELPRVSFDGKSAREIYGSAKNMGDPQQKLETLLKAFNAYTTDDYKGWAAHDIGDLYASKGHEVTAIEYYKHALQYGNEVCKQITWEDIKNYRLTSHFDNAGQ